MTFTKPKLTRWSEEEMREVEIPSPVRRGHGLASSLRAELSHRNRTTNKPHELTRGATPSIIYSPEPTSHGNFLDASYRRILAHPAWAARLEKAHTAKRQARPTGPDEQVRSWCELDTATSSDALLMNLFCYPRVLHSARLCSLLGVAPGTVPTFGYQPRIPVQPAFSAPNVPDRTEIDMRLGPLLVEAKLTESDFQFAPARLLERYPGFTAIFDCDLLPFTPRGVRSYQLLRGILAAHSEGALFCVFLDARRTDLLEDWYNVLRAVRSPMLQARLRVLTWQEIAATLPPIPRTFLAEKYGIVPTAPLRRMLRKKETPTLSCNIDVPSMSAASLRHK